MTETRIDSPRKEWTAHNEKRHIREESYKIEFSVGGTIIANYRSTDNTLYLCNKFIASRTMEDIRKPYTERIKGSQFESEFKQLLERYNNISEFTNM